ncbi:hypothetical protein [Natronobacterium gregoryi]|uniref:Uncharacterized protein n=2 Tax=Natronobacterium gregoryi TaxID=44930 RepID=L0AI43_NATGS|nr:hypothetical protein [Natronobacterium gregoryi]AFZ73481.1 hypothetical protein Natgr_2305 [Natronobacterium gregoryi SP2]ELY68334.1 hypothetical protein C490_09678 [Natronobacterium gregoryi SP2]PLK20505.1 hypothetical protein CYV19_09250 [Natronobacterium gregoryi SP2]SFI71027.1 hypothetical protein SAMN05443661_10422 [Natronobacterium gregoryi]
MMFRGNGMALSLLAVGTAAAAGYLLRSRRSRVETARSKADLGARIVSQTDVPDGATIVDASSERLSQIPGARRAITRALRNDARKEWEHVTLDREGAWSIVDSVRDSLPYYDGDDSEYNGVYVLCNDRIVVLDAIGWARLEQPRH